MSVGLILEGGGNRGTYTAGVLDVFMENDIYFPMTYGVSAGACNALSYISKQKGRSIRVYLDYINDKRYLSFRRLKKTGSIYGFDFIFGELAHELVPFDYEEFFKSSMGLRVGATDCVTGKPVYYDKKLFDEELIHIRASCSLPVVTPIVEIEGKKLLDGGVSESIPIDTALADGYVNNVVILTREEGYVKKDKPEFPTPLLKRKYRDYPELVNTILRRPQEYNRETAKCRSLAEKNRAFVIYPSEPVNVGRYSRKRENLQHLYDLGVKDAREKLPELRRFIALNS